MIRVYDAANDLIEKHEYAGDFKRMVNLLLPNRLESSSASNQIDDEDDESNYEQEVDQAAANVAEQAKKPQH